MPEPKLDLTTNPCAQAQIKCAIVGIAATDMSGILIAMMMMPSQLPAYRAKLLTLHEQLDDAKQAIANLLDTVEGG